LGKNTNLAPIGTKLSSAGLEDTDVTC
jgi:hypothetical protein